MSNKFPSNFKFLSQSSSDVYESDLSPIKTQRKALSPTQLIRRELQKSSQEKHSPPTTFKLHLESTNSKADSLSSFTSLEEMLNNCNNSHMISSVPLHGSLTDRPNLSEKQENFKKNADFEVNIKHPLHIFQQNKDKTKDLFGKRASENIQLLKPIKEEESPLIKIIRKKKKQEELEDSLKHLEEKNVQKPNNFTLKPEKIDEIQKHPFRKLVFSPIIHENLFKKHLLITYKGLIYAKKLAQPSAEFLETRKIELPVQENKKSKGFVIIYCKFF